MEQLRLLPREIVLAWIRPDAVCSSYRRSVLVDIFQMDKLLTSTNSPAGIQFPVNEDGRRSSTETARMVFAEAARSLNEELARCIRADSRWRSHYGRYLADLVGQAALASDVALKVAEDGLEAVHRRFRFIRDGEDMPLDEAMRRFKEPVFHSAEIRGKGKRLEQLLIPHQGEQLSGDPLRRQIGEWVTTGVMEPSAGQALEEMVLRNETLDLRDLDFTLLGAGAEVGPVEILSKLGANIIAVDIDRPAVWKKLMTIAHRGAGRMLLPVKGTVSAKSDDHAITAAAGSDLLTHAPEIRTWLAELGRPSCIGGFAYLHGLNHVRVEVAMDVIMQDLTAESKDCTLAFLLSPTDTFIVPDNAAEEAKEKFSTEGFCRVWRGPIRTLTGRRLYAPNIEKKISRTSGVNYGLYDGILPAQGPNYALAKRIQQWRSLAARASGTTISANVAPVTATSSVTMRRDFTAAFSGAASYGVKIFQPDTANAIMAALMVHDLRYEDVAGNPATQLDHPLALFIVKAVHGGLWRTGLQLRSVLEIAALRGFLSGLTGRSKF